jgi:hypothetical protein
MAEPNPRIKTILPVFFPGLFFAAALAVPARVLELGKVW